MTTIPMEVKWMCDLYQILAQVEEAVDNKQPIPQEVINNLTWHATHLHTALLDNGIHPDTGETI